MPLKVGADVQFDDDMEGKLTQWLVQNMWMCRAWTANRVKILARFGMKHCKSQGVGDGRRCIQHQDVPGDEKDAVRAAVLLASLTGAQGAMCFQVMNAVMIDVNKFSSIGA